MSAFNFGRRLAENFNQFERHKTLPKEVREQRGFKLPVRNMYIHAARCRKATMCGLDIAETYSVDPTYYGRTFCCTCQDYYLLEEFIWWDGEQNLDTVKFPDQYPPGWKPRRDFRDYKLDSFPEDENA